MTLLGEMTHRKFFTFGKAWKRLVTLQKGKKKLAKILTDS